MRLRWVIVLAASVLLLPASSAGLAAPLTPPQQPVGALDLLRRAGIECGTFDGQYTCRFVPGGRQFGKNAGQDPTPQPESSGQPYATAPAPGTWSSETSPSGAPAPDPTVCQGGMVGTPPNCRCPPNSELLGGNCVRYTASTCSNAIAVDALPQACRGVEEKLSCKMREDGLKDCCCVTYDKF